MNRSLRQWHFRLVAGLAPAAALTLAASILSRRATPDNPVPAFLRATPPADSREVARSIIRGDGVALELRRLTNPAGASFIELRPLSESRAADVLVYLGHGRSDAFPGDSRLLGAFSGAGPATFALPADDTVGYAELLLYSGATRTMLAHVDLAGSGKAVP